MKISTWFGAVVVCAVAVNAAADIKVLLARDGRFEVGETGVVLSPSFHLEGWKGVASPSAPSASFPDEKTGKAKWRLRQSNKMLGHGTTALKATDGGAVSFRMELTSDLDQKAEAVVLAANLDAARFGGRKWTAQTDKGPKSGVFPVVFNPKVCGFFSAPVSSITLETDANGRTITFAFPEPVRVHMQDSRRWGDNFTIRLGSGARTLAKGEKRIVAGTLSASEPLFVACQQPVRIEAGPDWISLDYRKDILAGSALDFSNQGLQDAPAGKYGWLANVNGHFEFEKQPGKLQRFYGVNLCFTANYPTHEAADNLIERLRRLGYNTIRVHHYERSLLAGKSGLDFSKENFDRIDYLLAKAIENGFYITTDVFVSRPVAWRDIGLADRGAGLIENKNLYKCLVAVWDPAFKDWCAFAEKFLLHVNPYTGRRYVDEPALPLISLINEGQMTMGWSRKEEPAREDPIIREAWAKWLAERRAADPGFCPDAPADAKNVTSYGKDNAAMSLFMADIERRSAARMAGFLRKIGCRALLTNANCGPHFTPMQFTREACYDYVDDHFYVDHPQFIEKAWSLPSRCGNANPVLSDKLPLTRVAFTRMADKPFTITEWNFSGPGMFRGVGGIMTGAFSALQDWDGLWRFAYSHSREGLADGGGRPGYFDVASDPLGQASDRASVCLFLRRDLAPLAEAEAYTITQSSLPVKGGRAPYVVPSWGTASWYRQVSTGTEGAKVRPGTTVRDLAQTHAATNAPFVCAPNPAFSMDAARGTFTINTPRTAGGFAPDGTLACGPVAFTVRGAPATVWASSVDAESTPITHARRLIVTHLTDVQAEGNVYAEDARQTLLKWGNKGTVVRAGAADVSLALAEPQGYVVYALETTGRRLEKIPSSIVDGKLRFTVSVAGPNGARMIYEVVKE